MESFECKARRFEGPDYFYVMAIENSGMLEFYLGHVHYADLKYCFSRVTETVSEEAIKKYVLACLRDYTNLFGMDKPVS